MKKASILFLICSLAIASCKKKDLDLNIATSSSGVQKYEIIFGTSVTDGSSYEWDFGDGTTSTSGPTPSHTYACPGQYTVKLTVTVDGQSISETQSVTVLPITFAKKYAYSDMTLAADVALVAGGGYAVFGSNNIDPYNQFYFIKTDYLGDKIWDKVYDAGGNLVSKSMCTTADGGYALFGTLEPSGSSGTDLYVLKIDGNGNKQWERSYGGNTRQDAGGIRQTADGGYILFGSTENTSNGGDFDYYLVKTDATGQVEWEKTFGGGQNDIAYALITTPDNGYAMVGYTVTNTNGYDVYLAKVSSSGTLEWEKTFGGAYEDIGISLDNSTAGGYVILGSKQPIAASLSTDMYVIKTNAMGEKEWENTFEEMGSEAGHAVRSTEDGGYILLGQIGLGGTQGTDYYLVKTSPSGMKEWSKKFGDTSNDVGIDVEEVSGCDGYILVGNRFFSTGLIKTDKNGEVQ